MENQSELADLVGESEHDRVAVGDQAVHGCKVRILRVLIERIDPAIADSKAAQVDPRVFFQLQSASNIGNIVASIALTSDVNLTAAVLGVLSREVVQEVVEILCDGTFGPAKRAQSVDEAEASSQRLVNVHHVCIIVPRVLVVLELERLLCVALAVFVPVWAILCIEAQLR